MLDRLKTQILSSEILRSLLDPRQQERAFSSNSSDFYWIQDMLSTRWGHMGWCGIRILAIFSIFISAKGCVTYGASEITGVLSYTMVIRLNYPLSYNVGEEVKKNPC